MTLIRARQPGITRVTRREAGGFVIVPGGTRGKELTQREFVFVVTPGVDVGVNAGYFDDPFGPPGELGTISQQPAGYRQKYFLVTLANDSFFVTFDVAQQWRGAVTLWVWLEGFNGDAAFEVNADSGGNGYMLANATALSAYLVANEGVPLEVYYSDSPDKPLGYVPDPVPAPYQLTMTIGDGSTESGYKDNPEGPPIEYGAISNEPIGLVVQQITSTTPSNMLVRFQNDEQLRDVDPMEFYLEGYNSDPGDAPVLLAWAGTGGYRDDAAIQALNDYFVAQRGNALKVWWTGKAFTPVAIGAEWMFDMLIGTSGGNTGYVAASGVGAISREPADYDVLLRLDCENAPRTLRITSDRAVEWRGASAIECYVEDWNDQRGDTPLTLAWDVPGTTYLIADVGQPFCSFLNDSVSKTKRVWWKAVA